MYFYCDVRSEQVFHKSLGLSIPGALAQAPLGADVQAIRVVDGVIEAMIGTRLSETETALFMAWRPAPELALLVATLCELHDKATSPNIPPQKPMPVEGL